MNPKRPLWRILALLLAFGLVAAACGDDDDTAAGTDNGGDNGTAQEKTCENPGQIADQDGNGAATMNDVDLSGMDVTVGSKDFVEQLVLGQLIVHGLQAAGANVTDQTDTGGTSVVRQALESGDIDIFASYNGTGWTQHLGCEDPVSDSQQLTEQVRSLDLAKNNIRWIDRSPFNDTYGFAASPALADEHGGPFDMQGMADYLAENSDATVCMESEFPDRSDGLVLFENATGYEIPQDQTQILDTGIIYEQTAAGECDFGEVFTTDGRIASLGLSLVDDPGVMIIYNTSLTIPEDLYQQAPEQWETFGDLFFSKLTQENMTELNRRVAEGEEPSAVAEDFLKTQGLIS